MLNVQENGKLERNDSGNHLKPPRSGGGGSSLMGMEKDGLLIRSSSIEGRFHIIDEKRKESSSSFDEESSDDNNAIAHPVTFNRSHSGFISKCLSRTGAFSQLNSSTSQPKMTTSASRFKIVPLESKYKRGRWECWDSYDDGISKKNARDDFVERPSKVSFAISNGSSTSLTSPTRLPVSHPSISITPPNHKPASGTPEIMRHHYPKFVLSDESDQENLPMFDDRPKSTNRMLPKGSPDNNTAAGKEVFSSADDSASMNSALRASPDFVSMSGRITPSELLQQYGLERSLSAAAYNDRSILGLLPPSSTSDDSSGGANMNWHSTIQNNSGAGVPATAIDSKIEQAMDLVKTHLMYAVREEIEQLRTRIIDLETTVIQLEAENSILREHVPDNILKNLNLSSSTQPTAVAQ